MDGFHAAFCMIDLVIALEWIDWNFSDFCTFINRIWILDGILSFINKFWMD